MRFYKTKLLILFMIVAAGATFYYFGDSQKLINTSLELINQTPLQSVVEESEAIDKDKINLDIKNTIQNAKEELSTLNERSKEVQKHTGNVLSASIEATDDAVPIHEKAFEYGKYIYCKSVVEDFESFNDL